MRLGDTGIWTFLLDLQPVAAARDAVAELEAMGYGTVWLPEAMGRDPFVHAALLLGATESLHVGTGVATIHARDAMATVSAQRTLAGAFGERFVLGLGVSHQPMVEGVRGHVYERPVATMRAYLERMDAAPFAATGGREPAPRLLAALGPRMLALAAERAGGALPYLVPPEHTALARAALGESPMLAVEQAVALTTDPGEARDLGRQHLAIYLGLPNYTNNWRRLGFDDDDFTGGGSDRLVDALVAWGDEQAIADRVAAHRAAGADHVCLQVLTADVRTLPMDVWRRLAAT